MCACACVRARVSSVRISTCVGLPSLYTSVLSCTLLGCSLLPRHLQIVRDNYRDSCLKAEVGMHKDAVFRFLEVQTIINSPFIPHWCEEIWAIMGKKGFVTAAPWPTTEPVDNLLLRQSKYLRDSLKNFRNTAAKSAKQKKPPKDFDKTRGCIIVATEYEVWKQDTLKFCATIFDDASKSFPKDFMKQMKAFCASTPELKKMTKKIMQFVMFIKPDVEANGRSELSLESPFNEMNLINDNIAYIKKCIAENGVTNVTAMLVTDAACTVPPEKKQQAAPGKPYLYVG